MRVFRVILPAVLAAAMLGLLAWVLAPVRPVVSPAVISPATESESTQLSLYVIGEEPADMGRVLAAINERLMDELDVELAIRFISPKNALREYPVVFSSGEDFDMICVSTDPWQPPTALPGLRRAYLPLTEDMLRRFAPLTLAELDAEHLRALADNGSLPMVPATLPPQSAMAIVVRGDLLERAGLPLPTGMASLETYLYAVRDMDSPILPYAVGESSLPLLQAMLLQPNGYALADAAFFALDMSADPPELRWLPGTNEGRQYFDTLLRWRRDGIIPANSAARKRVGAEAFAEGQSALFVGTLQECANLLREVRRFHPGYRPRLVYPDGPAPPVLRAAGIAVRNGSKNAAKSLNFIELLHQDEALMLLFNLGLEGVHYRRVDEGAYESLERRWAYPPYANPAWQMSPRCLLTARDLPEAEIQNRLRQGARVELALGNAWMPPDSYEALAIRYAYPLSLGAFDELDDMLAQFAADAAEAGDPARRDVILQGR
ncbi:MAG: hypothetical protein FWD25_11425 [Clostridia bacterium]|nr:hypothetical protein [Clostridia bacterium]